MESESEYIGSWFSRGDEPVVFTLSFSCTILDSELRKDRNCFIKGRSKTVKSFVVKVRRSPNMVYGVNENADKKKSVDIGYGVIYNNQT